VSFLDYQALLFLGFCVKRFLGYHVVLFLGFCVTIAPNMRLSGPAEVALSNGL
jgi:hypothetical protein